MTLNTTFRKFRLLVLALSLGCAHQVFSQGKVNWTTNFGRDKSFIENKGQFFVPGNSVPATDILYAIEDGNTRVLFTKAGVTFSMVDMNKRKKTEEEKSEELRTGMKCQTNRVGLKKDIVHMRWLGANSNVVVKAEEMAADLHSYSNKDFSGAWINTAEIRSYKKLTYVNIYPGIDVEYVIHPVEGFKYTIILHPGADISKFQMQYSDVNNMTIDPNGNLLIPTLFGNITDHAPVTFYADNKASVISSKYVLNNSIITFNLGKYDNTKTVHVDPWTVNPAFGNCNKIWECEHDALGNVYLYGGDSPMRLRKYSNAGVLLWTFNTAWDTSSFWVGSFVVNQAGESFCTSGSNGEIVKVNTTVGGQVWYNNPNGFLGPLFEYWHLTFDCDETQLVVGGMRAPSPFSIANYRGAVMNINLASGAVISFVAVGWVAGLNIKEAKTIACAPNGNFYFMTLDSVGCVTPAMSLSWKTTSGYGFSYGTCGYGVTNQGINAIRCTAGSIYTQNGTTVHQRNIANGVISATAAIPGGSSNSSFGNSPNNSGLDIDNCGNVYCGSINQVVKYDAALNQLSTAATSGAVYDVSVNINGDVIACGPGYASQISMTACAPIVLNCNASVPLSVTSSFNNINCFGQCTGTASVTASGGNGVYTYLWAPSGGTSASATGLCVGTYTCTITDGLGATITATFNITQPATALTATSTQTNILCSGGTGSAAVVASGGTASYSYAWSPSGGTGSSASGLASGGYTCTITDANGCSTTQTFNITTPTAIAPSIVSFTDATCGNNDGTATANATGGTGPYTYAWTPSGGNAAAATNLGAGIYTVTVTDANNCTSTTTVSISNIGAPTVTVQSITNVTCFGLTDGASTVSASGTGPFTYNWAPTGGNTASATNLGAGVYTVTVTDAGNCTAIQTITITEPLAITSSVTAVDATCGSSNGSASVTPTGGTGPFTYVWSNSQTSQQITGLASGTYSVVITDANGCTSTATSFINNAGAPNITVTNTLDVMCFGQTGGAAAISASGGQGPYTYSWSPSGGTGTSATNLGAGTYTVTVTGSDGCTQTQTVTITQPPAIVVTSSSVPDDCNSSNGSAAITVSGGTPGFVYLWSSGSSNDTITNLATGSYTCTITDANGCTQVTTVLVGLSGSAIADAGIDVTITQGNSTILTGSGGITYSWTPANSLDCPTCQTPNATPSVTTTYILTVTDSLGCSDTDTVTVYVDIICGEVYLPSAFSPNGDNQNDIYYVRGNCIEVLQFEIYNRWGELVFTTTTTAEGWDGIWRGKECEAAVFTYFIRATMMDGSLFEDEGSISLVK